MSSLPAGFTVEAVDVRTAPDEVLHAMFTIATQIEQEDVPEPPWVPASDWVAELRADAGIQDRADCASPRSTARSPQRGSHEPTSGQWATSSSGGTAGARPSSGSPTPLRAS